MPSTTLIVLILSISQSFVNTETTHRREPVRAPIAYLRRVDGVDVELVGLVLGLPVEPKAPYVPVEAVDNAFSAERPERRNCGKRKNTQSRYLPFQNGWRARRVCLTGWIVPSSLK